MGASWIRARAGVVFFGGFLLATSLLTLPQSALAAAYGSDTYGGGTYNVGVVPTPAPVPSPSGGGGGVISGPLSVGFLVLATTTTFSITSSTTPIASVRATSTPVRSTQAPSQPDTSFTHSLQFRDHDPDVKRLQTYLNAHHFQVAALGGGASGNETDYFGALTLAALIRFQNSHADEILKPLGLAVGTGYFGPATRAYIGSASDD